LGRILVMGATGFIGSHLVDRLLELGHEVTGLDCFTDYYSQDFKQRNLDRALSHGGYRFFEDDLSHSNLNKIIGGVDKVAHLTGEPGVHSSWGERFSVYVERDVQATQRLLEAVSRVRSKHVVLASSSSDTARTTEDRWSRTIRGCPPHLTDSPSSPPRSSSGR
jgi:UDP-glucuronate 4-epimerase